MPFKPGRKSTGRPKGSLNKRTLAFQEVLERHNFNPAEAMIEIFLEAKKIYQGYAVIYEAIRSAKSGEAGYDVPLEDKCDKYLKIAGEMAKELASYSYAKRKAIEQTVDPELVEVVKALENKTDEELLAIVSKKNS